jgi:hypothetical protein
MVLSSPLYSFSQADNCLIIGMVDEFGDGWNGATYTITNWKGIIVKTGTLTTGFYGEENFCLSDGCYTINVTGGTFPSEIYWAIQDVNEDFVEGFGASSAQFSVGTINPGCTSPSACNYDEFFGIGTANCDDGSCCFSNCVTVYMFDEFGDGWNGGSLSFQNASGTLVETVLLEEGGFGIAQVCLPSGCYSAIVIGGTFPSEISWSLFNPYDPDGGYEGGAPGIFPIQVGNVTQGCLDVSANNYEPYATCSDASCEYCTPTMRLEMYDNGNDGWEGSSLSIYQTNGSKVLEYTLPKGGYRSIDICLPFTCNTYSVFVEGGSQPSEISYTITHLLDGIVYNGNGSTMTSIYADNVLYGCTDPVANNYNPAANCPGCNTCIYGPAESCVGDLNNDNFVNISDLLIFLGAYGTSCETVISK